MSENLHRKDLGPLDEARALKLDWLIANVLAMGLANEAGVALSQAGSVRAGLAAVAALLEAAGFSPSRPNVTQEDYLRSRGLGISKAMLRKKLQLLNLSAAAEARLDGVGLTEAGLRAFVRLDDADQALLLDAIEGDVDGTENASAAQMAAVMAARMLDPQSDLDRCLVLDVEGLRAGVVTPLAASDSAYLTIKAELEAGRTLTLGGKLAAAQCPRCGKFMGAEGCRGPHAEEVPPDEVSMPVDVVIGPDKASAPPEPVLPPVPPVKASPPVEPVAPPPSPPASAIPAAPPVTVHVDSPQVTVQVDSPQITVDAPQVTVQVDADALAGRVASRMPIAAPSADGAPGGVVAPLDERVIGVLDRMLDRLERMEDILNDLEAQAVSAVEREITRQGRYDNLGGLLHAPLTDKHNTNYLWDEGYAKATPPGNTTRQRYRTPDGQVASVQTGTPLETAPRKLADLERRRPAQQQISGRLARRLDSIRQETIARLRMQQEGRIDRRRLPAALAGREDVRTRISTSDDTGMAVSLLLDQSGSMADHIRTGRLYDATCVIGQAMEQISIPYEVRGHGGASTQYKSMGDGALDPRRAARLTEDSGRAPPSAS